MGKVLRQSEKVLGLVRPDRRSGEGDACSRGGVKRRTVEREGCSLTLQVGRQDQIRRTCLLSPFLQSLIDTLDEVLSIISTPRIMSDFWEKTQTKDHPLLKKKSSALV